MQSPSDTGVKSEVWKKNRKGISTAAPFELKNKIISKTTRNGYTNLPQSIGQRTIRRPPSNTGGVPVNPKLQGRFYEALVMLSVLDPNRGDHIDEDSRDMNRGYHIDMDSFEPEPDPADLDSFQLRRSFLRHLAYLCDYEKGGDTTTAIALQNTPQGIIYRMASNKASHDTDRTLIFLREILDILSRPQHSSSVTDIESEIFQKSVRYSSRRISFYASVLEGDIEFVSEYLIDKGIVAPGAIDQT